MRRSLIFQQSLALINVNASQLSKHLLIIRTSTLSLSFHGSVLYGSLDAVI